MSSIRIDPLTGQSILLSRERAGRAAAFLSDPPLPREDCPFCPGNEDQTPPEISRLERGGLWTIRVVPNRYPMIAASTAARASTPREESQELGISGYHEVLIESPVHDAQFDLLAEEPAADIVQCYLTRYRAHAMDPAVRSITIFKNEGRSAGASIPHLHSQLVAFHRVPDRALHELRFFSSGSCSFCHLEKGPGMIAVTGNFVVTAAEVARAPYQLRIVPRSHATSWVDLQASELRELSAVLQRSLRALFTLLGRVSFNWTFQNAPRLDGDVQLPFHWYCEITPRLTVEAGFELATGIVTNIVDPLDAAAHLRKVF
ncbi:MAG TPA: DUF4921 family protein [Thermoanaerobaculia bacterium]|nr:DUF4921 family protein [Thermoanaerobaculia bacterium]